MKHSVDSPNDIQQDEKKFNNVNREDENKIDEQNENIIKDNKNQTTSILISKNKKNSTSPNYLATFLQPFLQRFQFTPQILFQDRLDLLKETLNNYKSSEIKNQTKTARQFSGSNGNGLLHLIGLDDHGFYTDRLEPAGLLGGNGWFSNKGGLLGGPGAILSTGSILTDYPTPY